MTSEREPSRQAKIPTGVILGVFVVALAFHAAGFVAWRTGERVGFERARDKHNTEALIAVWLAALGIGLVSVRGAQADKRRRPARSVRHPLCCNCLVPYIEGAHFCPTCACPLTWFAGTGSYEGVYAKAWILGKAANHPTRPLHLWLLVAPAAATVALLLVTLWWISLESQSGSAPGLVGLVHMIPTVLLAALQVAFALRAWSRWGLASDDADDDKPPVRYGSPPWWTWDEHWRVPIASGDDAE